MAFRDELGAAHARADALERRVAELEAENERLQRGDETADGPDPGQRFRRSVLVFAVAIILLGGGVVAAALVFESPMVAIVVAVLVATFTVSVGVLSTLLEHVPPGFALVISGRRHRVAGTDRGYRVVTHGRVLPVPIIEMVEKLDLRPRPVSRVLSVYTKSAERSTIRVQAVIALAPVMPGIDNAIERFLGRDMAEVDRVAVELCEAAVREVAAELETAQIKDDPERFSDEVIRAARESMDATGITIDELAAQIN